MKLKFTFFDLLVIIPILLFCVYIFVNNPNGTVETRGLGGERDVFLNITLESVISDEVTGDFSVGDPVVEVESGRIIGHITDIKYSDFIIYHSSLKENALYPDKKKAFITVGVEAHQNNGIFTVENTSLAIGADYKLLAPNMAFDGVCVSMNEDIHRNDSDGIF